MKLRRWLAAAAILGIAALRIGRLDRGGLEDQRLCGAAKCRRGPVEVERLCRIVLQRPRHVEVQRLRGIAARCRRRRRPAAGVDHAVIGRSHLFKRFVRAWAFSPPIWSMGLGALLLAGAAAIGGEADAFTLYYAGGEDTSVTFIGTAAVGDAACANGSCRSTFAQESSLLRTALLSADPPANRIQVPTFTAASVCGSMPV